MSPKGAGALAYWHCGGTVESRSGPLAPEAARRLLALHAELAAACDAGDLAAIFCNRMRLQIAAAIAAADAWRAAAASSCVR